MPVILGSELVLYNRCILETKLNVVDFEINKETDAPGAIQQMGTGTVTVTYKPTGIARHYRDEVVPPPHLEFERELKMNIFETRERSLRWVPLALVQIAQQRGETSCP